MKKILIIFLALFIILCAGLIYLNRVFLPKKINSLIVSGLQEATQKKVGLQQLEFSIFKGLVLRNLTLSDGAKPLLSIKEASCRFLIPPLFKKRLIIPSVNIDSAVIFLERRQDNSFNLEELFRVSSPKQPGSGFGIFVSRVKIKNSRIDFQDDALSPAFAKSIDNVSLVVSLLLPARVKFTLKAKIPGQEALTIDASGEFKIPGQELNAKISLQNISPQEFSGYYQNFGIVIPQGLIDALVGLKFKGNILYFDILGNCKNLNISKEKLNVLLNSKLEFKGQYSPIDKQLEFSGEANLVSSEISGIEKIASFEDIYGRIEFNQNGLKWSDLNFRYLQMPCKIKGALTNFQAPSVQLELSSKNLSLDSAFTVNNKLIKLSKCVGRYFNCEFSIAGGINFAQSPDDLEADINGRLNINLEDSKEALKKFKDKIEKVKPQGVIDVEFNLAGNINDIKSCSIGAKFLSSSISLYGLKAKDFLLNYSQKDGIIDIEPIQLSLYGGNIQAKVNMNLNSGQLPYIASADIQGIKIEELKLDTPAKEKDIAGAITAQVKLNGASFDLSRLTGAGKILVRDGKLWQLNLFQGLGKLLFAEDFANIVFNEGSCDFSVGDEHIFTDNLAIKSNITDLSGSVKIGFDSSLDASLNVKVLDERVPLSGTFKDITTAILGQAGRFGVIKISGTLNEPKFKFQPVVSDIIKGLKEIIFGN